MPEQRKWKGEQAGGKGRRVMEDRLGQSGVGRKACQRGCALYGRCTGSTSGVVGTSVTCTCTNARYTSFEAGWWLCACFYALASNHDVLGQCNKQFMSAHSKDYWCFHWGNIYAPSSVSSTLSLQSGRRAGGGEGRDPLRDVSISWVELTPSSCSGRAADAKFTSFTSGLVGYYISLQYR